MQNNNNNSSFSYLNDEQIHVMIERISQEISMKAIARTFITLGIDPQNPIEAQKDMAALRELRKLYENSNFQQDLAQLRTWRKSLDKIKERGFFTSLALIAMGGLALIVFALKNKLF